MRRRFRGEVRLKHLNQSGHFPSGNPRFYYRPKGAKGLRMPDAQLCSAEFLRAYVAVHGDAPERSVETFVDGTIGAGVTAYLGSEAFLRMAESTRERWRSRCDDIRAKYGVSYLTGLRAVHIKQDLSSFDGHSANNRLKVWRSLCKYWDKKGMIEFNIALQVSPDDTKKAEGAEPWTRDDFVAFRSHWSIGTKERLAFELMYRTCASIGDVTRLSRSMIKDGWLSYSRQKSKSMANCPFYVDGPAWFEATGDLDSCLAIEPEHPTILTTQQGKPRSPKSAASWFAKAAQSAGLEPRKTSHGIRKGRSSMFKENGVSVDQRMAILGHETRSEADKYSKSADLRRTIVGMK